MDTKSTMGDKMRKLFAVVLSSMLMLVSLIAPVISADAATIYENDGGAYGEGYIFPGESHAFIMAKAMGSFTDHEGNVIDMEGVRYHYRADDSASEGQLGTPNTFTMSGNLFFVFESWGVDAENKTQVDKSYIYSDGNGKMGRGVEKIHAIMEANLNILHWNIIAWHGASAIANADCYFLFMPTITKCCRGGRSRNDINDALAAAYPEQYLDYKDFFCARYPQGMKDPTEKTDTLQKMSESVTVEEWQEVLYTNGLTVLYRQPGLGEAVALVPLGDASFPLFEAGLPLQVTGVTDNGFYQITFEGMTYYIPEIGLCDLEDKNA